MNSVRNKLHALNDQLEAGAIDAETWADEFDAVLLQGHQKAIFLGRLRAGQTGISEEDFLNEARAAKDAEAEFLRGFLDAHINKDPRYYNEDGTIRPGAFDDRTDLYVGKMRGSANDAFVDGSEDTAEFNWLLGAAERHCADCPRIAALSPFTKDTLIGTPGDGETECLGKCDCILERTDGVKGFERVDFDDYAMAA